MNDLTNRLRGIYEAGDKEVHVKRVFFEEGFIPPINIEAADYIEKLEKEIRRLEVVNKSTCSDKDLLIAHSNKLYGTWSQTRCNDSGVMDLINELGEVFDSTEAESLAEIKAKAVVPYSEFAAEVDDYLNTNNLTSIGHGSELHRKASNLRKGGE